MAIKRVGIVGSGIMGSGIAEVAALGGIDVRVAEATPDAVEAGRRRITASLDRGMELGCAHPMGPLRLLDLIGLDTAQAVAESMYEEYKEPLYAPPALLRRMVAAGHLGRKNGRGFYAYDSASPTGRKETSPPSAGASS